MPAASRGKENPASVTRAILARGRGEGTFKGKGAILQDNAGKGNAEMVMRQPNSLETGKRKNINEWNVQRRLDHNSGSPCLQVAADEIGHIADGV